MIAIFSTQEAAQAYCDERSTARGYPITGKHPRTGKEYVIVAAWDAPVKHPTAEMWRVNADESGPPPKRGELVKEPGPDWDRYSPFIGAVRATQEEAAKLACTETDPVAMMVLLDKITPEQAAEAAREHPDADMRIALIQKEEEVYLWVKTRSKS